ncbi:WxL domain-containing protein [Enterococcus sp. DIV0876]|uniref:WxL domain-containing protein n=1 Tax=Enterococcus sp. DIV0876 TaxID=2774633 RepID=UPI003D2FABEE
MSIQFSEKVAVSLFTVAATLMTPVLVSATTYNGANEAESEVFGSIIASDAGNEIPPVNPGEPSPEVDPDLVNPDRGEDYFSIRYVSQLNFGQTPHSSLPYVRQAYRDANTQILDEATGQYTAAENQVWIEDLRNNENRTDWVLTVQQTADFMGGAVITMNPYVHAATTTNFGVHTPSSALTLNLQPQNFAWAAQTDSTKAGDFAISMGEVTVSIPAGVGVSTYETSLKWNLTAQP